MEKQYLSVNGRDGVVINIEYYQHPKYQSKIYLDLKGHDDRELQICVDASIFATLIVILQRVLLNWDGVVLVTGDVGDGKSTLAQLIVTIWEWFFDRKQKMDVIVWTSENFTSLVEKEDNHTSAILWDEAIQGGTGRDSITKQGQALKRAFVTKRYKQHLYLLLVDEIQEYNKKIISRTRAWIHTYTKGLQRGHFLIYNDKTQIRRMYRKIKKFDMEIEEVVKGEKPQFKGYQEDTSDLFFDPKEYKEKKSKETNQEDEPKLNSVESRFKEHRKKLVEYLVKTGLKQKEIGAIMGVERSRVSDIINDR